MKKIAYVVVSAAALSLLAISSASAAGQKAEATQAKISKADAEKIVVTKNPGAKVVSTTEATVAGHKVWALSVITTGGNVSKKLYVDQETGKISR